MKISLNIQDSKALAFLNFIKTLDYVKVEGENSDEMKLSDSEKAIIDQRIQKHDSGESKSFSWEDVKKKARSAK